MEGRKKTRKTFIKKSAVSKTNIEAALPVLNRKGLLANAAGQAIEKQFADNLPAIYVENRAIYKVYSDGRKELIKKLRPRRIKAIRKAVES